MTKVTLFGPEIAPYCEAWFEADEGRRAGRLEKALLGRLLEEVGPPADLLEIGCGTGHVFRWMSGLGWRVLGVDLSA